MNKCFSYKNLFLSILLFVLNPIAHPSIVDHFRNEIDSLIHLIPKTEEKNQADIYNRIAEIFAKGNNKSALFYADTALYIARKYGQQKNEIDALRMQAYGLYYSFHKYDEARAKIMEALEIAKEINWEYGMALIYWDIGKAYYEDDDIETAIEYFDESLKIFNRINSIDGKMKVWFFYGLIYQDLPDYTKALKYYLKICSKLHLHPDSNKIAFNVNVGNVHYNIALI